MHSSSKVTFTVVREEAGTCIFFSPPMETTSQVFTFMVLPIRLMTSSAVVWAGAKWIIKPFSAMTLEVFALSSMSSGSNFSTAHSFLMLLMTSSARRFSILQSSSKVTFTVVRLSSPHTRTVTVSSPAPSAA